MKKQRADILLVEQGLSDTREKAQTTILAGEAWVGEQRIEKPSSLVPIESQLEIRSSRGQFVSRGGEKLAHAIEHFNVSPNERVCLDIGASTGGFTDCLVQNGASLVFSVDVGYGQLDFNLRNHEKVVVLEKCNARKLESSQLEKKNSRASEIDLVVIDVSFISLRKIIASAKVCVCHPSDWLLLYKPQFELGREFVLKKGLVKDQAQVVKSLEQFQIFMEAEGFSQIGIPEISPIAGKKSGNLEYLIHYVCEK